MRKASIVLGLFVAGYSLARILLDTRYQEDPRMLRVMSRLLIAPDSPLVDLVQAERDKANAEGLKTAFEFSRENLRRNPASPFRWCDLGFILLDAGRKDEARRCFERALKLGPNLIANLSRASEFYDSVGEPRESLRCQSRLLTLAPSYKDSILATYASSRYNLQDVLDYGLPHDAPLARAFFRYLIGVGEKEPLQQAWKWLDERSFPDGKLTNEYLDFMIREREYDQAVALWMSHAGKGKTGYRISNFLYNPGFESDFGGSPFDWRVSEAQGVEVARDSDIAYLGRWSVRVVFGGKANLNYRHFSQDVILKPGSYRFRARMRTADISTDKGVALRIHDPESAARLNVRTEDFLGTHDWTELRAEIRVPEQTRMIRIELVRDPSLKFDDKIKGTVWLDECSLTPER